MVKKILISSIMIISLISCGNKSQQNDSAKNNTENKVIENGSWNIDTQQSDAINEDNKRTIRCKKRINAIFRKSSR